MAEVYGCWINNPPDLTCQPLTNCGKDMASVMKKWARAMINGLKTLQIVERDAASSKSWPQNASGPYDAFDVGISANISSLNTGLSLIARSYDRNRRIVMRTKLQPVA
ncbi:hypothetical protein CA13_02900 [Planctomycetes bacterium CA13]|uniref:Uncharacterized protein n=1 Tax=Novipirellula herctigrandis TaxID=2527986 RepID=A0A5C5YWD0_9BACT|nr:hypothetical protein CA13_02900 [Planctomycetes bacterium CA13]